LSNIMNEAFFSFGSYIWRFEFGGWHDNDVKIGQEDRNCLWEKKLQSAAEVGLKDYKM
jgi:hypothetical protein